MALADTALSSPRGMSTALASWSLTESPIRSLGGIAFPASTLRFVASKPLFDVVAISSAGRVFIVGTKAGAGYLCHGELSPNITISYPPGAPAHRSQELEWRRTHGETLKAFAGEWIVLEGKDIVAHGHDPSKVVAEARTKGVRVPYIFYVETRGEDVVSLGL